MESQGHQLPMHNTSPDQTQTPKPRVPTNIVQKVRTNLAMKSKWSELNGAMGDLGTYIPIVLALTLVSDLNLGTTLIFTGIYNIVTGAIYGVPMPVQPMKAIAAVAISSGPNGFGVPEIMASGICTGGVMLFLGLTGLMQWVYKFVPLCVVRGIQLSQGLSFAMTAVKYVRTEQDFSKSNKSSGSSRPWLGLDGLVLALVCACFVVFVNGARGGGCDDVDSNDRTNSDDNVNVSSTNGELGSERRNDKGVNRFWRIIYSLPSAFIVFVLGVILGFIRRPNIVHEIKFGPSSIQVVKITKQAWKDGFIKGTIPQLPLSILNSVIAVCKLSSDLFPSKEFSASSVSITVGLMNIAGCWFGSMPCCHGAGGLAGQYKFGGRSGGCVAILGVAKLVLGLVLGSSMIVILTMFPVGVLGVLLLFAGVELALAARDMNSKEECFVMLVCAAVSLVGSSAALGFVSALVVHVILKLRSYTAGQS